MIRIRLAKHGSKNNPFYRIVAVEKRRKNKGKPLEVIGYWYPKKDLKKIDKEKFKSWVNKGAKASQAVSKLLN